MAKSYYREIEMFIKPFTSMTDTTPKARKYKIPEHLRRNKKKHVRSK